MRTKTLTTAILALLTFSSFAQKDFTISTASKIYTAKIHVAKCKEQTCSGNGTIKIYRAGSMVMVQAFKSKDLYFNLDDQNKPSSKMERYDEESPLFFGDFNFDGIEDLAIRNGNNSSYGGPSYDIYVYDPARKRFVLNKQLTNLASTNLGMFDIDVKTKRIITHQKSGAAWHSTTEYEVVPKKGLLKVRELEEDATKGDDLVYVTEKKYANGKWKRSTKKYKQKDYYKD